VVCSVRVGVSWYDQQDDLVALESMYFDRVDRLSVIAAEPDNSSTDR